MQVEQVVDEIFNILQDKSTENYRDGFYDDSAHVSDQMKRTEFITIDRCVRNETIRSFIGKNIYTPEEEVTEEIIAIVWGILTTHMIKAILTRICTIDIDETNNDSHNRKHTRITHLYVNAYKDWNMKKMAINVQAAEVTKRNSTSVEANILCTILIDEWSQKFTIYFKTHKEGADFDFFVRVFGRCINDVLAAYYANVNAYYIFNPMRPIKFFGVQVTPPENDNITLKRGAANILMNQKTYYIRIC